MAARTGMKLEDIFRAKYCLKKEDDLFQLIESAMKVAVVEKKAEFHKRKARIAQILNIQGADDPVFLISDDSDDDDEELPQISPPAVADSGLRENKNSEKIVQGNNNKRHGIEEKQRAKDKGSKGSGDDEKIRFGASERKLEQRYRDLEKRKRKVEFVEIKDAPMLEKSGRVAKKIRF
nr:hypothetical protein Itr_chr10CG03020 [Ipomoea trifida]